MTKDDIIRMARGATDHLPDADSIRLQGIVLLALDAGEQAEREACARLCDMYSKANAESDNAVAMLDHLANSIRARGTNDSY